LAFKIPDWEDIVDNEFTPSKTYYYKPHKPSGPAGFPTHRIPPRNLNYHCIHIP